MNLTVESIQVDVGAKIVMSKSFCGTSHKVVLMLGRLYKRLRNTPL